MNANIRSREYSSVSGISCVLINPGEETKFNLHRRFFRLALRLFKYKAIPIELKGIPATICANSKAYVQPLSIQGVIAYLDDVLVHSLDVSPEGAILEQVHSIFRRCNVLHLPAGKPELIFSATRCV